MVQEFEKARNMTASTLAFVYYFCLLVNLSMFNEHLLSVKLCVSCSEKTVFLSSLHATWRSFTSTMCSCGALCILSLWNLSLGIVVICLFLFFLPFPCCFISNLSFVFALLNIILYQSVSQMFVE